MARSVPEWIGATPDTPVPPRVRLRNFRDHDGICHISGRKIMPGDDWQTDHVIAIIDGGENRESNLAPALNDAIGHKGKTAAEVARKARVDARAKSHIGITKQVGPDKAIRSAPMPTTRKAAARSVRTSDRIGVPAPRMPPGFVSAAKGTA